jgi:predicted TIM-barrel fold metal-dependent hydrolase
MSDLSRRNFLVAVAVAQLDRALIDTHIHLFAADQRRFPYHKDAVYRPPASPLEEYAVFAKQAKIAGTVIVHPEPYQDDHRYLEYCFANEPARGFFKGTCLFDPISPQTPARMSGLVRKNKGRIVALRIHCTREAGKAATTSGAIRDRDLTSAAMKQTWRAAHDLGLAIQMHIIPVHAAQVAALANEFRDTNVIIDHLARAGQGTSAEYDEVLKMAKLPHVYMKFSGPTPPSLKTVVRRTFDAFGPNRMIWGGLGMNMAEFRQNSVMFEELFDFASAAEQAKIQGLNARVLFGFSA